MRRLNGLFSTIFSPELAWGDEERLEALQRIRANPDTRQIDGLKSELQLLLSNESTDWVKLLDENEVYMAKNQEDGKQFVTQKIWNPLFS